MGAGEAHNSPIIADGRGESSGESRRDRHHFLLARVNHNFAVESVLKKVSS